MVDIIPGRGLDRASFGEDRESLRRRLGEHASFRRMAGDPPTDHFLAEGLLLSFDQEDRLNFIEATDRADLHYLGVRLTGQPFGAVIEALSERGVAVRVDASGGELEGLDVYLYTPAPDEMDVEVEAVAIKGPSSERSPHEESLPGSDADGEVDALF
jgi:hypothetical protein